MSTQFSQTVFSPWLTPVRLVATSNVSGTYYNGPNNNGVDATLTVAASSLTIDSVVCNLYDRVLLTDQSSSFQNGIYVVVSIGATVVLQRSADFQDRPQMQEGQYVSVGAGTVNAGNLYVLIEPLPNNIGVDGIVFSEDPASGAAVTFSGPGSTANQLAVFSNTAGDIKAPSTTMTSGYGLTVATGNLVATAGNLVAGSSGNAGTVTSFPGTASEGSLLLAAVSNAGGNFTSTLSNAASVGQNTVYTFPDPAGATANVAVAPSALVSGNLVQASGTAGLLIDSGLVAGTFAKTATVSLTSANITGMYATPVSVLAAPGAGKINIIDSVQWDYAYSTAQYTAGGLITLQYGSNAHAGGTVVTTGIAAATFNGLAANGQLYDTAAPWGAANTVCENAAVYVSNATQAFASGSGTVTLYIRYRTVTPA
jgi:hypothetical protein